MILDDLARYYDILAADEDSGVAPLGYSWKDVPNLALISKDGELIGIIPNKRTIKTGKKEIEKPRSELLPERVIRSSGVSANFLADNGKYMFGLKVADKDGEKVIETDTKYFEAFKKLNTDMLSGADGICATALLRFLEKWNPAENTENPLIKAVQDELGSNFLFCADTWSDKTNNDEEIRRIWDTKPSSQEITELQCSVCGEVLPIAKLHNAINGVKDAQSSGAALVSFNNDSFESYNKKQSHNAAVSEKVMFKYTTALNRLLKKEYRQCIQIGDATTVFWAETAEADYMSVQMLFGNISDEDRPDDVEKIQNEISASLEAIKNGIKPDLSAFKVREDTKFYIFGLSPNASRLSLRFYSKSTFGDFFKNVARHYADMEIVGATDRIFKQVPLWRIVAETVSPKSSDKKPNPVLSGALMRSILFGSDYPETLLAAIVNRVKKDGDKPVNHVRAAVIKACINRKNKTLKLKEDITVSLNENATDQAYVLGRLFAVLETVQQRAIGNVNATIKDRFFSSACATPASVYPSLLKLAQSHLSKLEKSGYWEKLISELLGKMQEITFPNQLDLEAQGKFIIGYYHQHAVLYAKKNPDKPENEASDDTNNVDAPQ